MLASRQQPSSYQTEGCILVNGRPLPASDQSTFREITRFVEQDDALIGALTVRETLHFSSRLASSSSSIPSRQERTSRVNALLDSFGLSEQADTLVGTPIRKGISGGQKRRLGVAGQLITSPKILFLDEPTSGLDSQAGWEVMNYLKGVARRNNLIVVASIHQPSTATFNLFDKVLLLSKGRTHYFGGVEGVAGYFESVGREVPLHVNPAEWLLELVNVDFNNGGGSGEGGGKSKRERLDELQRAWAASDRAREVAAAIAAVEAKAAKVKKEERSDDDLGEQVERKPGMPSLVLTLLHRSFVKSYRDVVAYGIRLAMYTGEFLFPCFFLVVYVWPFVKRGDKRTNCFSVERGTLHLPCTWDDELTKPPFLFTVQVSPS